MKIRIVFAWIFALLMVGPVVTASRGTDETRTNTGAYSVIKGRIADWGNNGSWDFLSFGVLSDKGMKARVNRIVITDLSGEQVFAEIQDFFSFRDNGASWYFVGLRQYNLPAEFKTWIYISTKDGGEVLMREAQGDGSGGTPIDPDETVIVVKWP